MIIITPKPVKNVICILLIVPLIIDWQTQWPAFLELLSQIKRQAKIVSSHVGEVLKQFFYFPHFLSLPGYFVRVWGERGGRRHTVSQTQTAGRHSRSMDSDGAHNINKDEKEKLDKLYQLMPHLNR